ncbi:MAG TPA: phosphodiester glycosidase family protein [Conexibacter sp.]
MKTLSQSGWVDEQVLSVDLGNSAVRTNLLTSPFVAQGTPLSQIADRDGAVAGVNGDFFDIDNSQAPQGAEVRSGQPLKSGDFGAGGDIGVTKDGIGTLVDATLDAHATIKGTDYPVQTVNAPNNLAKLPADSLMAFTSGWGTYNRLRSADGSTAVAEALVENNKVVSVNTTGAGDGAIPADGFYLVGTGAQAAVLAALQPGDDATLAYGLKDSLAQSLEWGVGANQVIVRDGALAIGHDTSQAPRTAIGFKDGGRTMLLVTDDGRQTDVVGPGVDFIGQQMIDLGADFAVNLDGGGSTTMMASYLGDRDVTVRNTPSDGTERADPNGVGIFVTPGDGQVDDLVFRPAGDDARVFPGMHRTMTVKGIDSDMTPVALSRSDVRWNTDTGTIDGGLLAAPADDANATIKVRAATDGAQADDNVRVLGSLDSLELNSTRLAIQAAVPEDAFQLRVTGRDGQGYTAPVEDTDLDLDYDHSVVRITPSGSGLKVTPLKNGGTLLTITAGGRSIQLPIAVGVTNQQVYNFADGGVAAGKWGTNGTAGITLSDTPDGIQMDYPKARNMGFNAKTAADDIALPGQPLLIHMRVKSTVPVSLTWAIFPQAGGGSQQIYGPPLRAGWNDLTFAPTASARFPLSFSELQAIETSAGNQQPGSITVSDISVDEPAQVDLPDAPALRVDPIVSPDGRLQQNRDAWTFGALSDIQFTADAPTLAQTGIAAIKRIRATDPDFLILNGDVTDRGLPQDMTLARQTLETAGCDITPVGSEPAPDSTPDPSTGRIPCYYVPGNHESYGLGNVQADLRPFIAEFGQPYRYFDHKGTRFILLASSLGSLHGTAWAQMPMFAAALDSAKDDPSIKNVMVFAHHPVDDPRDTKDSQLGDRTEVALVERMLSDFRNETDKGVAMVGSHAQIMNVHRIEGVPYIVMPSSGKDPYGTPDAGGFTGWVRMGINPDADASSNWLDLDVHTFAQEIDLNTPDSLEVGNTAQISGSEIQPEGVQPGSRVVPLRYPTSVRWSGSDDLAIGSGDDAIQAARDADKVAIFDPVTEQLTALKSGSVALTAAEDSMSTSDDLSPVTATRTIKVVASTADGSQVSIGAPTFPDQAATTISPGQALTISNTGNEPLQIGLDRVETLAGDKGDFIVSDDACSGNPVAPGNACAILVRFAPGHANVTSSAKLVFSDNTAEQRHTVIVTANSVDLPKGDKGDQGPQGIPGEDGPTGPVGQTGQTGPTGPTGPTGTDGAAGPQGAAGNDGAQGPAGNDGAAGPQGPTGNDGAAGPQGTQGPAGNDGAQGVAGPRGDKGDKGDKGDRGAAGRDALVTCTVKSSSGLYERVTCTVTYSAKTASAAKVIKKTSIATLVKNNKTVATGKVGQLRGKKGKKVKRGTYTLRVKTGKKTASLPVSIR